MTPATKRPKVGHHAVTPKKRMLDLTARQICSAHNLAGIVDRGWSRVISPQSAQIPHHSVFPQERVCRCTKLRGVIARRIYGRSSDYLPLIVDVISTALIATQRSEIDDLTILPKDGMLRQPARHRIEVAGLRRSRDPPTFIDHVGPTKVVETGQCAEVSQDTVLPLKSVREETIWVETQVWIGHVGIGGRDVRCPDDHPSIV